MPTPNDRPILINITAGTFFKALLVLVLFYFAYQIRDVLLILLTSIVLASAVEPFVKGLNRFHIPRPVGGIVVYAVIAGIFFLLSILFVPPMISELQKLSTILPDYLSSLDVTTILPDEISPDELVGGDIVSAVSLEQAINQVRNALAGLSGGFFQTAATLFGGALSAILILVISFYFVVQEKGIENFLRVIAPIQEENKVLDLWRRTQKKIGLWLQGQLLLAVIIGILVYLGLAILRVEYAVTLAFLAAVLELIPIFGPIIAAVPAVIIAFTQSPALGFMTLGLYFIIQQFENQLIHPLVVTKIVGIPPILVIISLLIGASLAGFLGVLIAIPISTLLVEIYDDMERQKVAIHERRKKAA